MKSNLFLFRFHCWPGLRARANPDAALAAAHLYLYLHWEQALVLTVPKIAPSSMSVIPLVHEESYRLVLLKPSLK